MVRCEPRMSAYATALREAITPGCTVIDLGAGPGVFAILACRYGAGKVIAIEPDASIELLHQLARDNGYADRIEIFRGVSSDYRPSQLADVIVSDLRGGLPLFEHHVAVIKDARERLLAPGGRLIPLRDQLFVAAVEAAETYRDFHEPWRSNAYDLDLSAAHRFVINQQSRAAFKAEGLVGPAQHVATLDYATISDPNLARKATLSIERAGLVHGLLMWFDAELGPGAFYTNAPGQPEQVYSQTFFPLETPIAVESGDRVEVEIKATLIDGSYTWSWNTRLVRAGAAEAEAGFRQSTFLSTIFSSAKLATRAADFVPAKTEAMAIDGLCLSLVDGVRSLRDIAERVEAHYPDAFARSSDALDRVTKVAGRHGGKS